MTKKSTQELLHKIEYLREELYAVVDGKLERLNTKEVCEVSNRLDNLIVKHMCNNKKQ